MKRLVPILLILALLPGLGSCTSIRLAAERVRAGAGPPHVPVGVLAIRDIPFTTTPNGTLRLDVYRPEVPEIDRLPVVLFVFGGGWMMGNRNAVDRLDFLRLVGRGYAVVTADYRLSSQAPFPAQIHDVKAAIRWIRVNARDQGFDPNRIATLGPSAGGHLAALAATSGDVAYLDGDLSGWSAAEREASTRVQAAVDFFGPTDLAVFREQHAANGLGSPRRLVFLERLVGGSLEDHADLVELANPIRYVSADDPPFLIIHGDRDPVVPYQQSLMLEAALEAADVDVTLITIPKGGHGGRAFRSSEVFEQIVAFLDRALSPAPLSDSP